jgi:hypothetical protein
MARKWNEYMYAAGSRPASAAAAMAQRRARLQSQSHLSETRTAICAEKGKLDEAQKQP